MKIIEILRLHEMGMSQREIGTSAGCGKSTIGDVLRLCNAKEINHETAVKLTDNELQKILYPKTQTTAKAEPDWAAIREEMAKHKNLNLQFMWEEYRTQSPEGLSYSRFCELYRKYRRESGRQVSLYNERKSGELMEVDWMGDTLACVAGSETGELTAAHFFIAVLGYSHYPYVEAFPNEQESSWITGHVNALGYYGGAPRIITPDNCRTAVKTPKYYEPVINGAYWELARHYETAIIPARIKKPKDKPAVEYSVGWLETWLLGKLRNQRFFSFEELNKTITKYIRELSAKPFQKREGSRYSEYIKIDKPALRPLPAHKYEIADVVKKKVSDNYHLEYAGFYYSVPYTLYKEEVILRATSAMIEIIDKNQTRITSHERRYIRGKGRYVTRDEHMPPNHQAVYRQRQFDGSRYRSWAKTVGENTWFIIDSLLTGAKAEEQSYKSCMGILQFTKTYGSQRLETACSRAREIGSHTYSTIKNILNNETQSSFNVSKATPEHENIRGSGYYR